MGSQSSEGVLIELGSELGSIVKSELGAGGSGGRQNCSTRTLVFRTKGPETYPGYRSDTRGRGA
eukprot:1376940-Prorocentrum_lima.AAC.1